MGKKRGWSRIEGKGGEIYSEKGKQSSSWIYLTGSSNFVGKSLVTASPAVFRPQNITYIGMSQPQNDANTPSGHIRAGQGGFGPFSITQLCIFNPKVLRASSAALSRVSLQRSNAEK